LAGALKQNGIKHVGHKTGATCIKEECYNILLCCTGVSNCVDFITKDLPKRWMISYYFDFYRTGNIFLQMEH
jgi:hypothetical protein